MKEWLAALALLSATCLPLVAQASVDPAPVASFRTLTGWPLVFLIAAPVVLLVLLALQLYFIHELSKIGHCLRPVRNEARSAKAGGGNESVSLNPVTERLDRLAEEFRNQADRPEPAREIAKSLRQFEDRTRTALAEAVDTAARTGAETAAAKWEQFLARKGEQREQEQADSLHAESEGDAPGSAVAGDSSLNVLWPEIFRPEGSLSASRELLEKELRDREPTAIALFIALLDVQLALEQPLSSRTEFARRLQQFSLRLMRWAHRHEKSGELPDPLPRWREVYEKAVTPVYPALSLRPSYPGTPFDPDTMIRDEAHSGNGGTVAVSLSWAVVDNKEDSPRVLQRALVITA